MMNWRQYMISLMCTAVIFSAAGYMSGRFKAERSTIATARASTADVSALIDQLRPYTQSTITRWFGFRSGVTVTFYGAEVIVTLHLLNGQKYQSRAPTLQQAVARIVQPPTDLQSALAGWLKQQGDSHGQ